MKLYHSVILTLKVSVITVCVIWTSCKKNDSLGSNNPSNDTTVRSFVVDSSQSNLLSTDQDLNNGVFKYDKLVGSETIKKGDFFIEQRNYGYLRRVEKVNKTPSSVEVSTSDATISDFYKDSGLINKQISIPATSNPFARNVHNANVKDNIRQKISGSAKTNLVIPGFSIESGGISIEFSNIELHMDLNFAWGLDVRNKYLKVGLENTQTTLSYKISVNAIGKGNMNYNTKLSERGLFATTLIPFSIGPLIGFIKPDLIIKGGIVSDAGGELNYEYDNNQVTTAYFEYSNSTPNGILKAINPTYVSKVAFNYKQTLGVSVSITPVFEIEIVNKPIVNLGVELTGEVKQNISVNPDEALWDSEANASASFYGVMEKKQFPFLPKDLEFKSELAKVKFYETPKKIQTISGANQTATKGSTLPLLIVFKVLDSRDKPQERVKVFFTSNLGHWSNPFVLSSSDGTVSNKFTLDSSAQTNVLNIEIRNSKNELIDKQSLYFTPQDQNPPPPPPTTDTTTCLETFIWGTLFNEHAFGVDISYESKIMGSYQYCEDYTGTVKEGNDAWIGITFRLKKRQTITATAFISYYVSCPRTDSNHYFESKDSIIKRTFTCK